MASVLGPKITMTLIHINVLQWLKFVTVIGASQFLYVIPRYFCMHCAVQKIIDRR